MTLNGTAFPPGSELTIRLASTEADVAFSVAGLPAQQQSEFLLSAAGTVLTASFDAVVASLCEVEVLVSPDCPDQYVKVAIELATNGPLLGLPLVAGASPAEPVLLSHEVTTITYPFWYALEMRARLSGRVEHVDDRFKPACAPRTPVRVTVTATVQYQLDKAALAAWGPARFVTCSHVYSTNILSSDGEFILGIATPAAPGGTFPVNVTYEGNAVPAIAGGVSKPLMTIRRTLDVFVSAPTYPGATPPLSYVQPALMVPADAPPSSPLNGTLVSVQDAYASILAEPAALIVELTDAVYGRQVVTTSAATFTFGPQLPGMYELRVLAGPSLPTSLRIVEIVRSVSYDDSAIEVPVVFVRASTASMSVLLVPYGALNAAVGLHVLFSASNASTRVGCHVFEGRQQCGGASWRGMATVGQMITLEPKAVSTSFSMYVAADRQLCRGYGRASSSSLPGGNNAGVDCLGDCSTGRSYCYAANNNLCASCVLWEPVGEEVLCMGFGVPQGGPLPGTAEWAALGCPSTGGDGRTDANNTTNASTLFNSSLLNASFSCPVLVAPALSVMLVPPQLGTNASNASVVDGVVKPIAWPMPSWPLAAAP